MTSKNHTLSCRVKLILKSRRIPLSKVAQDTGIAYTTLHRLYAEKFDRVDAKTLETICNYLGLVPGDLLRLDSQGNISHTLTEDDFVQMLISALIEDHLMEMSAARNDQEVRLKTLMSEIHHAIAAFIQDEMAEANQIAIEATAANIYRILTLAKEVLPSEQTTTESLIAIVERSLIPEVLEKSHIRAVIEDLISLLAGSNESPDIRDALRHLNDKLARSPATTPPPPVMVDLPTYDPGLLGDDE